MKKILFFILLIPLFVLTACGQSKNEETNVNNFVSSVNNTSSVNASTSEVAVIVPSLIGNPASINCTDQGGEFQIMVKENASEYGICLFEDNRQCEEWALMRGDCPVGGLKITGYDNNQQIYCAITGGKVNMNKNTCTIKNKVCDLTEYYFGTCNAS